MVSSSNERKDLEQFGAPLAYSQRIALTKGRFRFSKGNHARGVRDAVRRRELASELFHESRGIASPTDRLPVATQRGRPAQTSPRSRARGTKAHRDPVYHG